MEMPKEEYDPNEARADYIARMELEGYKVVLPGPNELQIDIDSDEDYSRWLTAKAVLDRNKVEHQVLRERPSRGGLPGRHIVVWLPEPLDPWQRIALQGALGSDHVRELLSCIRMLRGDEHPTLLVEKKDPA